MAETVLMQELCHCPLMLRSIWDSLESRHQVVVRLCWQASQPRALLVQEYAVAGEVALLQVSGQLRL